MTTLQKIAKWYAEYTASEFQELPKDSLASIRENPSYVGLCYTTYEEEDDNGDWHEGDIQVSMNLVDPSLSVEIWWDGDEKWHEKVEKYDTLEELSERLISSDGWCLGWDDFYSWAIHFVWEFLDGEAK